MSDSKSEVSSPQSSTPGDSTTQPSLKSKAGWWLRPIAILAAAVLFYMFVAKPPEVPRTEKKESPASLVETTTVVAHTAGLTIDVDGLVVPFREIDIAAEVAGRIEFKSPVCNEGHYVENGTLLLRIDSRDYELERDRLAREVEQAQASLEELEVELTNTRGLVELSKQDLKLQLKEIGRLQELIKTRVVTESEIDQQQRQVITSQNALRVQENMARLLQTRRQRLETTEQLARVGLEKANIDLSRTEIRAPINGVVLKDSLEEDSFVQKGASLVLMEDTSRAEISCNLRMDELHWLWQQHHREDLASQEEQVSVHRKYEIPQLPVTVLYRMAGREFTWQGHLSRYAGLGLDARTRTVPIRVAVDNPREVSLVSDSKRFVAQLGPPALLRGMFVTVAIHITPQEELVQLPERAVRPGNRVWEFHAQGEKDGEYQGKLEIHEQVEIAQSTGGKVLVYAQQSGLTAGDQVIVTPLSNPTPGQLIRRKSEVSQPRVPDQNEEEPGT